MSIKILKNYLIFDGRSEEPLEGGSIVIENDKVSAIGYRSDVGFAGPKLTSATGNFR